MTIPAFGRCTPVQIALLSLAGFDLEEREPAFIRDEEKRLEVMRFGRRDLVLTTKQDYGFDLALWREYLIANGEESGYTHPYAFRGVDKAIQRAIDDPEFRRLARLAESSSGDGTCRAVLDRIGEKLGTLRHAWEREPKRFDTDFSVGPPLTEADIRQVEVQYGLTFPIEYRVFRLRFGDTATGPGVAFCRLKDGLTPDSRKPFPLSHPLLGECDLARQQMTQDQQHADNPRLSAAWDAVPKGHGVIKVSDYGCAIYAFMILNGPYRGRVWMLQGDTSYYGPYDFFDVMDGADEIYPPVQPPKDYSFLEWYEHWLDLQLKLVH